jgi:hypothetical protein
MRWFLGLGFVAVTVASAGMAVVSAFLGAVVFGISFVVLGGLGLVGLRTVILSRRLW